MEGGDIAEKETERVEVVAAGLEQNKAIHFVEERLQGVGLLAPAVARAEEKAGMLRGANHSGFEQQLELAIPALPAPVIIGHEPHPGLFARNDELLRLCNVRGERFRVEDGDISRRRYAGERQVGLYGGADIDEIGPHGIEQRGEIVKNRVEAKFRLEGLSAVERAVVEGDDPRVRHGLPGDELDFREVAGAAKQTAQRGRGNGGHGRCEESDQPPLRPRRVSGRTKTLAVGGFGRGLGGDAGDGGEDFAFGGENALFQQGAGFLEIAGA